MRRPFPTERLLSPLALLAATLLGACASDPAAVSPPYHVVAPPEPVGLARPVNGAIFQAGQVAHPLFGAQRRPLKVGDAIKVSIDEKLSAGRQLATDTERSNEVASKGPGSTGNSLFQKLLNLNATAAGSDSFKGKGSTENNSQFSGQITAAVINVLPNGHLVVAGERSILLNGGSGLLRFSGIVDPQDVQVGNRVASGDIINARFELGGAGDVQDTASRSWLQRLLTRQLTVW